MMLHLPSYFLLFKSFAIQKKEGDIFIEEGSWYRCEKVYSFHDVNAYKLLKQCLCILVSELAGSYAQVGQNLQPTAPTLPPKGDGSLTQTPQLELVSHSMVGIFDSMGFEKFDLLLGFISHFLLSF